MNTILEKIIASIRINEKENFEKFEHSKMVLKKRIEPIQIIPLLKKEFFLITEIKKGSPSKGIIRKNFDPVEIAKAYTKGGASAISVITEKNHFFGEKEYLTQVRNVTALPILRKDFIIHPYQVYESYSLGADFILIIAACLSDAELFDLYKLALSLGMSAFIEVHDEDELQRALKLNPAIIGINNRDLNTFEVNINNSYRLKKLIPEEISVISESGIKTHDDINKLKESGFAGALIGESILKQDNLSEAVRKLLYG
jgi:indole-3-glycerol phosphate synthase